MGVINVLDKHIAELIAAGEVVERPASVIKEVVENAIDAGATQITVEIKKGGTTFMRVTDNGCGILRDDVKKAFLPHATSKIKKEDDLDKIATLGFRGEALSSISSVSRVEIITKNQQEPLGTKYQINGGEEGELADTGCPNGTTIIIRDLFYNIPARMKFLKKDISEGNAVSAVLDKIALSHPEIAFTYIKDGKNILKTSGDGKLISAVYSIYGRDFANGLIPVKYELGGVKIRGYVSKPVNARPNRNLQIFFINGRYVKSRTAGVAVDEASKGSVMVGKFSSCVLHIQISYETVDVNVHPSKIEVRFMNERPIFDAVYHGVKSALLQGDERKEVILKSNKPDLPNPFSMAKSVFAQKERDIQKQREEKPANPFDELDQTVVNDNSVPTNPEYKPLGPLSVSDSHSGLVPPENPLDLYKTAASSQAQHNRNVYTQPDDDEEPIVYSPPKPADRITNISQAEEPVMDAGTTIPVSGKEPVVSAAEQQETKEIKPLVETEETGFQYIGELFKTYILVEKNAKELLMIDKHAAHEKIIYEKLKQEQGSGNVQILLAPITVTLNKTDYNAAINNLDAFNGAGFDTEDFGNSVLLVRSAPQYLEHVDISETIMEMAGYLSQHVNEVKTKQMDWIYHNISCRCAIKAGNKSTPEELIQIAKAVENDPDLRYCPHGRPVCIVLKKSEIEKYFGRV